MKPTLTLKRTQEIINHIEDHWFEGAQYNILNILKYHIYQDDKCLTRYAIILNDGYQIQSMTDFKKYKKEDAYIKKIGSISLQSIQELK